MEICKHMSYAYVCKPLLPFVRMYAQKNSCLKQIKLIIVSFRYAYCRLLSADCRHRLLLIFFTTQIQRTHIYLHKYILSTTQLMCYFRL